MPEINPLDHSKLIGTILGDRKVHWAVFRLGSFEDARQTAYLGLLDAAKRYDPAKNKVAWSTYACRSIKWALSANARTSTFVRIMSVTPKDLSRVSKERGELRKAQSDAAFNGLVNLIHDRNAYEACLAREPDDNAGAEECVSDRERMLDRLLAELPKLEAESIRHHFGFGRPRLTYVEASNALGCSPATVQRRHSAGLAKLQVIAKERGLQCPI